MLFRVFLKVLVLIFVFFISGCVGTSTPTASELPKWYLNPPMSNPAFYYGVGEGSSLDAAKSNALAQVAGTISTSVSSDLEINVNTSNGMVDENIVSKTKSSIQKIKFTGVSVVENSVARDKFYTLLKVDRGVLFASQKAQLDKSYKSMNSLYESSKKTNILQLLKNTKEIKSLADEVNVKLPILKAISADFNKAKYEKDIIDILNATRDAKREAMVYVTHIDAKNEAAVVKKHISSYGMTLIGDPSSVKNKNNLLKLNVSKTAKKENIKTSDPRLIGASFAKIVVTLDTKDHTNKTLANNRIEVINISKDGYEAAAMKTKKFEREIKQRGILNILLGSAE